MQNTGAECEAPIPGAASPAENERAATVLGVGRHNRVLGDDPGDLDGGGRIRDRDRACRGSRLDRATQDDVAGVRGSPDRDISSQAEGVSQCNTRKRGGNATCTTDQRSRGNGVGRADNEFASQNLGGPGVAVAAG